MSETLRKASPQYRLPNLFRLESAEVAQSLYAVAIPKLMWRGEPAEALWMLRKVRGYGRSAGVAKRHTAWTSGFELEALLALGEGERAWRLVRAQLREFYPRLAKEALSKRVPRMPHFVRYSEIPAAYFSGRIDHAVEAMELYLDWQLKSGTPYEMRNDIFNGDEQPSHHVRVTLFHLYRAKGQTLDHWARWRDWVRALHPRLLRLCQMTAEELAGDSALMPTFHQRLRVAERERRPAFVTFGQRDLLEPKGKVLARQKKAARAIEKPSKKHEARAAMLAEKREKYFPWLERSDGAR